MCPFHIDFCINPHIAFSQSIAAIQKDQYAILNLKINIKINIKWLQILENFVDMMFNDNMLFMTILSYILL